MDRTVNTISRRSFLAAGAAAFAAPLVLPGRVLGLDGATSPNSKITNSLIGYGNRGHDLLGVFMSGTYQCIGVCDCDKTHAQAAQERTNEHYKNKDCVIFPKYEDALARKDVDVIAIATPDHWHTKITVESCKAGKDVFCEKPLTLTLAEGIQIIEAARKYDRVVSSGSQRVMEDYGYLAPIIQSGVIGQVKEVFVEVGDPGKTCYLPEQPVPAELDWDRWLGQAPFVPYNDERRSGNYGGGWRRYEEYGNGFLADWGAHKFGGSLYALGLDTEFPVALFPKKCDENPKEYPCAVFKNGIRFYHCPGTNFDITFAGTEGTLKHGEHPTPKKVVDVRRYSGGANNIYEDFAYCVKNRLRPFQDVLYGARTAAFCQMMNILYKVNRPLHWNVEKFQFENDEHANRLVSRVQRSPYTIEV